MITAGLVEVVSMGVEYGTWKGSLISKVKKGLKMWEEDILSMVQISLDTLEQENINTITDISKSFIEAYTVDDCPTNNLDELSELLRRLENLERKII